MSRRANMRKSRKGRTASRRAASRRAASRRAASRRAASRKGRMASRRNRRQSGGWVVMNPAGVADNSMAASAKLNLAQGGEYKEMHKGQYGGGAPLEGAPVGTTGVLDSSLRVAAHLGPLDKSMAAIQGMSDQAGGARRRRSSRKASSRKASSRKASSRKASRKGRKASRKGRKASRKGSRRSTRRMRGGAALNPADFGAPGTLLPAALANKALMQMNPEWKLAEDPTAFSPKA
jgi:hypothetical protein